jgi:hypothetical protein
MIMGCSPYTQKGGNGSIRVTDGPVVIDAVVEQPESPRNSGTITVTNNGTKIVVSTGESRNDTDIIASANLLKVPMYAGIGLIIVGVLVGYFFRNIRWAIIIGCIGVTMIIGSYLLSKYAIYFLLGFAVLGIYGVFLLRDYILNKKSNEENVKLLQVLKKTGDVNEKKLSSLASVLQSKETKKIVKKIKENTHDPSNNRDRIS